MLFTLRNTFEDVELSALYKIEQECFDPCWTKSAFKREIKIAREKHFVWVVDVGSKIAGFLIAKKIVGALSIETCNVSRAYRRRGIASRLIEACESSGRQKGCKKIKLDVATDNPAQILYFQIGFRVCGFKRNYYGLKEHAVSMAKTLA